MEEEEGEEQAAVHSSRINLMKAKLTPTYAFASAHKSLLSLPHTRRHPSPSLSPLYYPSLSLVLYSTVSLALSLLFCCAFFSLTAVWRGQSKIIRTSEVTSHVDDEYSACQ